MVYGNTDLMLSPIKKEMWAESANYNIHEKEKSLIISTALKQIRTLYSK
jgi:hypothetical protein